MECFILLNTACWLASVMLHFLHTRLLTWFVFLLIPGCSYAISGLLRCMLSSFHIAFPVHFWSCKSNMIRGAWGLYSWLWSNRLLAVTDHVSILYRPCPGLINQFFPSLNILTTKEINVEKTWSCTRNSSECIFLGLSLSYIAVAKRSNTTLFILA